MRNNSDTDFTSVAIGKIKYRDIKRGATTNYPSWLDEVHNIERCTLFAKTVPLQSQPRDHNGKGPFRGTGKFTYVLSIVSGQLRIRAVDDSVNSIRK